MKKVKEEPVEVLDFPEIPEEERCCVDRDWKAECMRLEEELHYVRQEERRIRTDEGLKYEMRLKELEMKNQELQEKYEAELKYKDDIIKSILHIR